MNNEENQQIEKSVGQFLVYQAEDGSIKLEVRLEDESIWLTQQLMAELFQTTKQNINQHIQCICTFISSLVIQVIPKIRAVVSAGLCRRKRHIGENNYH